MRDVKVVRTERVDAVLHMENLTRVSTGELGHSAPQLICCTSKRLATRFMSRRLCLTGEGPTGSNLKECEAWELFRVASPRRVQDCRSVVLYLPRGGALFKRQGERKIRVQQLIWGWLPHRGHRCIGVARMGKPLRREPASTITREGDTDGGQARISLRVVARAASAA